MASLGHRPEELKDLLDQTLSRDGADQSCPFCHMDAGWEMIEPAFLQIGEVDIGAFHRPEGIPVLALGCRRCGFVRFHSTVILHRNDFRRRNA